ncbi:hypothetical protein D9M08_23960 [Escherichia albertii]|nr:hypothetical protein [Escherichia albertii]EEW0789566.1 hypothetical protein [Escherichia albertii]EEW4360592.1 hypothetical protein [Escherichia albertii]EEW7550285.1 hypothetical protein [Escherichia albertii]
MVPLNRIYALMLFYILESDPNGGDFCLGNVYVWEDISTFNRILVAITIKDIFLMILLFNNLIMLIW